MALTIENPEIEQLAAEVSKITGESTTEAIRRALVQRKFQLGFERDRSEELKSSLQWLETEVWPYIKPEYRGRRISKEEQDAIVGYGPDGV